MIKSFKNFGKVGITISLIDNEEDKKSAISIVDDVFKKYGGFSTIAGSVDFLSSIVLKKDGEVVGTYLLGTHPIHIIDKLKHYLGKRGIEGVALAVKPEYRNFGYGNMLKDYSTQIENVDYIWGMQLKDLNNIRDWTKRRRIVFSSNSLFMTLQDLRDTFPLIKQSNGINCGPTSLKMILDYYKIYNNLNINQITEIMETDVKFGTTDIRMKKGLDHCKLNYKQFSLDDSNAIDMLKNYLINDRKILLRTLTKGIKHWVVVYDYKDNLFWVSDPWLGKIKYNEKQIYNIWRPRNYDGFIVYGENTNFGIYDEDEFLESNSIMVDNIIKIF